MAYKLQSSESAHSEPRVYDNWNGRSWKTRVALPLNCARQVRSGFRCIRSWLMSLLVDRFRRSFWRRGRQPRMRDKRWLPRRSYIAGTSYPLHLLLALRCLLARRGRGADDMRRGGRAVAQAARPRAPETVVRASAHRLHDAQTLGPLLFRLYGPDARLLLSRGTGGTPAVARTTARFTRLLRKLAVHEYAVFVGHLESCDLHIA